MKFIIILLLLCSTVSCTDLNVKKSVNSSLSKNIYVFKATTDFEIQGQGDAPYYIDTNNNALAIDARVINNRNLFAQAITKFKGASGVYDVALTLLTEEDGEPIYHLLINDKVVAVTQAPYIGKGSERDLKTAQHIWPNIAVKKGDKIAIESVCRTNGEIPENGGTAWARGRWQKIEFSKHDSIRFGRPHFNIAKDLLIAQFDLQPDADDVHAIAALGSMLADEDFANLNYFAVSGTVGIQGGRFINSNTLFALAFGAENANWTDAKRNWEESLKRVQIRVEKTLAEGGKVWVQEAGQSNFTHDWVHALIESGVKETLIKQNIIVVQHSQWNEDKTTPEDLTFVKQKTNYISIDDGNEAKGTYNNSNPRGKVTPQYTDVKTKWLKSATGLQNKKSKPRKLWLLADEIVRNSGFNFPHSVIPKGGVDFSDIVESWWIFELNEKANSVHAFWARYVTDVALDVVNPRKGRLAVVVDGNSPDPDDIGATPVMFGLLQQARLSDRLVHLSHSCDLDPFKNKGLQQINAKNEARRQHILNQVSDKGTQLFGPFKHLRKFYNCRVDQAGATQDLVDAINASTQDNPLWIIEAGEPDLIGFALQNANPNTVKYVHVVSHHPANDDSGDYFTWQQILDFGITEHQIGDQNIGLQTAMHYWDWAKNHSHPGIALIWEMLAYAEQDGVVDFQTNKFDCSDAGMVYWWITGANRSGNNNSTPADIQMLLPQ